MLVACTLGFTLQVRVNSYKKVSQVPKSLGNFFYSAFDGYSWETAGSIKD